MKKILIIGLIFLFYFKGVSQTPVFNVSVIKKTEIKKKKLRRLKGKTKMSIIKWINMKYGTCLG